MVARRWGWDRVPARGEPGEQDAGDHQGPPRRSAPPSPLRKPGPAPWVDAYYRRLIGPHTHQPNEMEVDIP